ncbi:hypothetical protein RJ640_013867 [Escallonia rubra]|uniref:Bet v I/Major latex protein domain-containing protein n=1 Tax=Escallonia rubra TaxID=112253 RepID=A0AA88RHV6_9ASTE|nr:hypothetical protein RJ640_013867 [Escallonia rubra]
MENKTVVYKLIEGDIMELYKSFTVTLHVDTKGENNLVTWTFEYEKVNEGIQDPTNIMDFLVKVTKDIETHHLQHTPSEYAASSTPAASSKVGDEIAKGRTYYTPLRPDNARRSCTPLHLIYIYPCPKDL